MLKKYQKALVSSLAREVLQMGMIWGNELEEYIKVSLQGDMTIQSDNHYLEIENYFLDVVEREISEAIEVRVGDTVERVKTMKDAAAISGVSYPAISANLKIKRKIRIKSRKYNEKIVEFEILKPRLDRI